MNKVLINGSFRSGTSYIWKKFYDVYGSDVLYEPCHENLNRFISKGQKEKVDPLHGMAVWNVYTDLHADVIDSFFPYQISSLHDFDIDGYVSRLEELHHASLILQANRWHFFYNLFQDRGYRIFHVIRNPHEVYKSIYSAYSSQGGWCKRQIKRVLPEQYIGKKAFNNESFFRLSLEIKALEKKIIKEMSAKECFLYAWVIFNYYAIGSLGKNDKVIRYCRLPEDMVRVGKVLGLERGDLDTHDFILKSNDDSWLWGLRKFSIDFDLEHELNELWSVYEG